MAVGNIKSRLIDVFTPAAASSDLQIRTRTGGQPTEVPPRSPAQILGQKEVYMVPNGHAALQGLSSILDEAMKELDSPYHRCFAVVPAEPTGCSVTGNYRHEDVAQGRWDNLVLKALLVLIQD